MTAVLIVLAVGNRRSALTATTSRRAPAERSIAATPITPWKRRHDRLDAVVDSIAHGLARRPAARPRQGDHGHSEDDDARSSHDAGHYRSAGGQERLSWGKKSICSNDQLACRRWLAHTRPAPLVKRNFSELMTEPTTLGADLRRERERRGLALRSISENTKVSIALLEGLEADDISRWPGGIFRRAFVRAYAQWVGLDADEVMRRFEKQFPVEGAEAVDPAEALAAGGRPVVVRQFPSVPPLPRRPRLPAPGSWGRPPT